MISFETHILPILIFAVLGALAGILLTVASKVFYVKTDERIGEISDLLPQANCGACGYAGCADYAAAIVEKGVATNLCKPGGNETAQAASAVMGVTAEEIIPEIAILHCSGNCEATQKRFDFGGVQSCAAAKRFYGGNGLCSFGCIGLGDCVSVCDNQALAIVGGIAQVTPSLCGACGKCAKVCPNQLISIRPVTKHYDVRCSSKDNGKTTKLACKNGCIGCKICEKKCLNGAITVTDFHASIDYEKCTGCGQCYDACPIGCITCCEPTE